MNVNQTIEVASGPPVLQTLSAGRDCESLLCNDTHGNRFELRVLQPSSSMIETIDRISRQLSLIELSDSQSIRAVTQPLSDQTPYSFGLSLPSTVHPITNRLDLVLGTLELSERIDIARQLIDVVGEAHRIGLYHGSLAAETVLVDRHTSSIFAYIDFSATCFDEAIAVHDLSVEQDLASLRTLLQVLLRPLAESESAAPAPDAVSGRARAVLRRWLTDEDSLPPSIGQWQTVFPSAKNCESPADQTGVVDIREPANSGSTCNLEGGAPAAYRPELMAPKQLGRFQIVDKIGQGGMGAVYRAKDLANGSTVAVKVLCGTGKDIAQSIRRFRKEAHLLADAANDHVTRLIDVGEDGGTHYLAMEFIDGINLKQWLVDRGPLPESEALAIAADLARALAEAHSRDVVHRDIKPENVLLQLRADAESNDAALLQQRPISDYIVKLSDFGIARHVTQSESMEMTQAGAVLGTPKYMSPEQCKSAESIGPAADVYSLGVTLYQLLTGRVPFESDDYMKLAAMHCFDAPPSVQQRVAEVSDMTARIVDRALSKAPGDRYGDASQMLSDLLRTIRGEAAAIEAHPHIPDHDTGKLWEKTVSWTLESEPKSLWPLVSNTERLNEAIGLPAATYRTHKDPKLGVRKFGSFKLSGVAISWEEHPFEWIEGKRMGILREFDSGPFRWFMSVVTLESRPGGGTLLSHQVRIESRNLIGRALATIEADWKGFRNLNRVYQRMDRSIQSRHKHSADEVLDPFTDTNPPTGFVLSRIDERIESIIRRGATAKSSEALKTVLHQWAPQELSRIRPLSIAERMNVSSTEMVDACLLAATEGLLNLRWDILCPACRVTAASTDSLSNIASTTHCEACDVDFKSNLGNAIEMVFRVHPEIREVNDGQYCIGGPEHSPHVAVQVRLEAGECLDLDVNLAPGDYLIRGPRLSRIGRIRIETKSAPSFVDFTLSEIGAAPYSATPGRTADDHAQQ